MLPDALSELQTFSFWGIPGASKEKQPAHWNGSKWVFTDWQKEQNLEWIGDALHRSHGMKVNVGLVVPECWVLVDFDHCRDPVTGYIHPIVQRIIERLKTVVLVSSSGTGLHVILKFAPEQPLPDETRFTNPDLYLDIFEKEKQGELKKPGTFVAINWHPLPGYNALEMSVQEFPEWLEAELFIREETVPLTEPSEPTALPTPLPAAQERAPTRQEIKESPFGIRWKPSYRQAAINKLANWTTRPGDNDETISGDVFSWLMFYWKAAEEPDWDEALDLSVRAEGFYLKKQPPGSKRKPKPRKWHEYNVNKSLRLNTNKSLEERMVFKAKGEKYAKTAQEERILQALRYVQAKKMHPRDFVFVMEVVCQSGGRSHFKLTDGVIAERTGMNESSVTRAKKSLRDNYGAMLEIARNRYRIIE